MKSISITHKGKRAVNQDVILIKNINSDTYLYLISDGMGGYANGDIAAKIVADSVLTFLSHNQTFDELSIQKAINKANLAIRQYQKQIGSKLGATVGGIIISKNVVKYFWVGDVKILHYSDNTLIFESKSHSLTEELSKSSMSSSINIASRYSHIVTRSVQGNTEKSKISYSEYHLKSSDYLIISSDGAHNLIDSQTLLYLIKKEKSSFIEIVNERIFEEAVDNASLICITEFEQ